MSEFKIGDRVRIISDPKFIEFAGANSIIGMTGTVKELDEMSAGVEFDVYIGSHNGRWKGKNGYCWYIPYERLEKIEDTEEETKEEENEEIKAEALEQKILTVLREEIGVDTGEEFEVYQSGERQWTCRFDKNGFARITDKGNSVSFDESWVWKYIVSNFYKLKFKRKLFMPEYGEDYFFLAAEYDESNNIIFRVLHGTWIDNSIDYGMLALGNVFRSEEEALKSKDEMLEKLRKLRKGEQI